MSSRMINIFPLSSGDSVAALYEDREPLEDFQSYEELVRQIKGGFIASHYRIYVLNDDETLNYEIPNCDIKIGGSYSENYQIGQRRSLSFTLYNYEKKYTPSIDVLWIGTRIGLDIGLSFSSGSTVWFRKGVFIVNKVDVSITPQGQEVSVQAGDKFSLWESGLARLDTSYTIEPGENAAEVIKTILMTETGSGIPIDSKEPNIPLIYNDFEIQAKIQKEAGSTLGEILKEIATQMSAEIFYDSIGRLTFVPIDTVLLDDYRESVFSFDCDIGDTAGVGFSFDYSNVYNRIVVIATGSQGGYFRGESKNTNPNSPINIDRIGMRTANIIQDNSIYSEYLAKERADYELRCISILKTSQNVTVDLNPLISVDNVVKISSDFYGMDVERFVVQGISFSLDYSSTMQLTLTNLKNLPFFKLDAAWDPNTDYIRRLSYFIIGTSLMGSQDIIK